MSKLSIPVGILISSDGPYSVVSRSMCCGALLAVDEVNASGMSVALEPVIGNPGGQISRYASLSESMLSDGVRHVVGCYTSSSRKEIIPLFEKADALLWYPSHYEGFESSSNVIYTGPVANQHLFPLVEYLTRQVGTTAFCVGSNYIWAWENNRILREAIGFGGGVVAERYFPVGDVDFEQVIEAIIAARPSYIFNTLIGVSSYQFLRDLRASCSRRGINQIETMPVASCTLSEPELQAIGPTAMSGHITSSVYFSSIVSPENLAFVQAYAARHPESPIVSADAEATYLAVKLLALALAEAGSDDVDEVKAAVSRQVVKAPQGLVRIDPDTMHASLTPRIARSTEDGTFEILVQFPAPIRADPYLIRKSPRFGFSSIQGVARAAS